MSTTAQVPDQIEGLPPGAILRALPQQAIEGLPPGAILKPVGKAAVSATPTPATPPPEGFWHSLGTQLQGMLDPRSLFDPMHLPSPQQAAGIANDFANAASQSQHPISPATGQPIVDPLGHTKTLHMAAALLAPVGGGSLEKGLEQVESGNPKGAAGTATGMALPFALGGMLKPKAPAPAAEVTPSHVEALTGLIEDRGGTVDPHATATEALPHLRETAVRMGVDPTKLDGRAAGQATLKVAEQAVRDTQNEFNQIRKPYNPVLVDQSSIAKAYRDAITPELLANEPKVARALEAQAKKFDQPAPLEQVNQFRVRMNNQLNAFEQRGTTAQIMSDIETKASHAAANAARNVEYATVGRLSGLDPEYIRSLKQREGSLIEAKNSLTKEYNKASGGQGEAVSESMREKLTSTFPSKHGMQKSILKNVLGPKPIDVLNSRIQKMFAGMGAASDLPEYEQVQPPTAPQPVMEGDPSGPVSGGPEDVVGQATQHEPWIAPWTRTTPSWKRTNTVNTPTAPVPVANGQITPEHVAAENAFYTQARAELGADASASDVLRRAQALKVEHTAAGAGPPVTPVPPTVRPTLTQKMQAQPTPTLRRVNPPTRPSPVAEQSPRQQATALMLLVKQGKLTPAEADSRIQRLVGPAGRRLIRRPAALE